MIKVRVQGSEVQGFADKEGISKCGRGFQPRLIAAKSLSHVSWVEVRHEVKPALNPTKTFELLALNFEFF